MQSLSISRVFGVEFTHRALKPEGRKNRGSTVTWPDAEDHVKIVLSYEQIEMRIYQSQSWTGPPMACIICVSNYTFNGHGTEAIVPSSRGLISSKDKSRSMSTLSPRNIIAIGTLLDSSSHWHSIVSFPTCGNVIGRASELQ